MYSIGTTAENVEEMVALIRIVVVVVEKVSFMAALVVRVIILARR